MKSRFCNYYFKHQKKNDELAVILGEADDGGYLKIMTPYVSYRRELSVLRLGTKVTGEGCLFEDGRTVFSLPEFYGTVVFGGDGFNPGASGRREIISMDSILTGSLTLAGHTHDFTGGRGYIECERFRPQPVRYVWIHASDPVKGICVMMSLEEYRSFYRRKESCFAAVRWKGGEVSMSTESGAENDGSCDRFRLIQGRTELKTEVLGGIVLPDSRDSRYDKSGFYRLQSPAVVRIRLSDDNVCILEEVLLFASVEYYERDI